ncbi:hypothetical protein RJ640_010860 [Escallonia rubra]|uniref:Uncharacterized protein n=1 Tax=Escallonia rubra TaxID=112253 RepID=A0AA88UR83_9ASTE|nr:hypothetical protein RJ640_010860 [Escallonia rubra]
MGRIDQNASHSHHNQDLSQPDTSTPLDVPPPVANHHAYYQQETPARQQLQQPQANPIYASQPAPQPVQYPQHAFTPQAQPQIYIIPHAAFVQPSPGQYPIQTVPQPQVGTEGWRTGLFDCMDDPGNALVTMCFPCVTFGQVAEIVDNGHTSCATSGLLLGLVMCLIGWPCLITFTYRTKLRSRYGLVESPGPDWLIHCFCDCCALCQEYRELQLRGMDPSIGWQANVARYQNLQQQQQQVAMMPPMNQRMMG